MTFMNLRAVFLRGKLSSNWLKVSTYALLKQNSESSVFKKLFSWILFFQVSGSSEDHIAHDHFSHSSDIIFSLK